MNKTQIEKLEGQLAALCVDHGISTLGVTFMFQDGDNSQRFGALFIPNPRKGGVISFAIHKQLFDHMISSVKSIPSAQVLDEGCSNVMVVSPNDFKPDNQ